MTIGGFTRMECPIEACHWVLDIPDLEPVPDRLADALGLSAAGMGLNYLHQQAAETERTLRAHFETHPIEVWVTELMRARALARR